MRPVNERDAKYVAVLAGMKSLILHDYSFENAEAMAVDAEEAETAQYHATRGKIMEAKDLDELLDIMVNDLDLDEASMINYGILAGIAVAERMGKK